MGGEQDLTDINIFLSSTCCTLLDVNKDKFYKTLHEPATQDLLAQFANDRNQLALIISRIDHDKPKNEENQEEEKKDQQQIGDGLQGDEIRFSLKV